MLTLRLFLLSAVAALSVFAASIPPASAAASTYTVNGNVYRVVEFVGADSNEIRLSTVVKGPAANQPYAARVVPIKQARFASWLKPNLGSLIKANLWWMGFAAVIESAGWAIDELKGQVVQQAPGFVPGYYFTIRHPDPAKSGYGSTPVEACKNYHPSKPNGDKNTVEDGLCAWRDPVTGERLGRYEIVMSKCTAARSDLASCNGTPVTAPVSDADLQAAINAQLAADPAHAATAFTDPATGKGYADLFDPVPYIPGLSAADEALVNCYISGQLQMVNSQTACYVATQAEYDRVKQQAEALAAGKTPEAEADALNNDLKQPITQAQYEETNKKYSDAIADVTADVNAKNDSDYSDVDDKFSELDGIITDLPNTSLPAPAHLSVPQYVDCQQLHLSDGNGHELDFPNASQCAKIETFKQGFGYFLAISVVFLLCMQLLTRPHG